MIEELEKFDLSDDPFRVYQIFECFRYFLDCNLVFRLMVIGTADNTVSPMANLFDVLKLFLDQKACALTN